MPVIIEQIIAMERKDADSVMELQQKQIEALKILVQQKRQGRQVETTHIIKDLQRAGILTANEELAEPYISDDE